ncbi:MAG: Hint domain-containing protein [Pseudomonadota bacterium]
MDQIFLISWKDISVTGVRGQLNPVLCIGDEITLHSPPRPLGTIEPLPPRPSRRHARRAKARLGRMIGLSRTDDAVKLPDPVGADLELTDGIDTFSCWVLDTHLVFEGPRPDHDTLLIVTGVTNRGALPRTNGGVICFVEGTPIATPYGPVPVERLRADDMVLTRDNGAQPIAWRGARHLSGADLYAQPHHRPIRLRAGAIGVDKPDGDLLVSPDHRVMVDGPGARDLFNTPEVLLRAEDLLSQPGVATELRLQEVTYIHLAMERHEILWAAGVPCESFDPESADFAALEPEDRAALEIAFPEWRVPEGRARPTARRVLNMSEAAILGHRLH